MLVLDTISQLTMSLMMGVLITNIFPLRFSKIKTIIIYSIFCLVYFFATLPFSDLLYIKVPLSAVFSVLMLLYLSVGAIKRRLASILVVFGVIAIAEAVTGYGLVPLLQMDNTQIYPNTMSELRLVILAVYMNILFIEVIVASVLYKDIRKDIKLIIIALMLLVFTPQIIFILSIFSLAKDFVMQNSMLFIIVTTFITFFANIIVYILIERLVRFKKDESELAYMKKQSEMMHDYYRMVMQNVQETSALKHEISNQLQTAYALFADPEGSRADAVKLLDGIGENLLGLKRVNYCNRPIINTILSTKTALAREKCIDTDILTDNIQNLNITDMDLCSLFCNLYDNAIEACEKIEDVQKRFIRIRVTEKANFLMLSFVNSYKETEKPLLLGTTKKDSAYHGYGLKLIKSIAAKYSGHISYTADNGAFEVTLSLKTV